MNDCMEGSSGMEVHANSEQCHDCPSGASREGCKGLGLTTLPLGSMEVLDKGQSMPQFSQ